MRWFAALLLCFLPVMALAQDEDRDWLTAFIEDNLSGTDREVRIAGFAGALSSRATFDLLTIADGEGIWLTITDGAISLNRSALLGGRIEIAEMTAAKIDLPRTPVAQTTGPTPEAVPFALPELPVSVDIAAIKAGRVSLGEAVFGQAVEASLSGSLKLAGGEGEAALDIRRLDGPTGEVTLAASYVNATKVVKIDLLVAEAQDGIAATLIGLPDAPPVTLAVHGSGPVDKLSAEIALTTDGAPRLKGVVTLGATTTTAGASPQRDFRAELSGDIAPLFWPEYQAFFGPKVSLVAAGTRAPTGEMSLSELSVEAEALTLAGELQLAPDGLPRRAALDLKVGMPSGGEVLLPVAGARTTLRKADLRLTFDAAQDDGWTVSGDLRGLTRPDISVLALRVAGSGRINAAQDNLVGGTLNFVASGIAPADEALAQAIGPTLTGRAIFYGRHGTPLAIPMLRVTGQGYSAEGGLNLDGLDTGLEVTGRLAASLSSLERLSGLAGRPLSGQADARIDGSLAVLSGIFDLRAEVEGQDLTVGQPELDRLLQGRTSIAASVARDTEGTEVRSLSLSANNLTAELAGWLRSDDTDIGGTVDFTDLGILGKAYKGALKADAKVAGPQGALRLTATGSATGLGVGVAQFDQLLGGDTSLSLDASQQGDRIVLNAFAFDGAQVRASATGTSDAAGHRVDLEARLANLALLVPEFPGPVTVSGNVNATSAGYDLALDGSGPGGTSARLEGRVASDFDDVALTIQGGAQAALANPFIAPRSIQGPIRFDLSMLGKPGLEALTGDVSLSGARLVAPLLGVTLDQMEATARLGGGRAVVASTANVQGGGTVRVAGPVGLTAPFPADLTVTLSGASLRDPKLFTTTVAGTVAVTGPLTGGGRIAGALALGETEIRVPSSDMGVTGEIPDITHVGEPAAVRATRDRAGLAGNGGGDTAQARPFGMDITVSAPRRIFVRGRGLDAELGGTLRLGGTTDNLVPSGQFDLVRGRLDLLGKRFSLDEGLIQLRGAFEPYIRFAASTQADGVTVTITIEGQASEPVVSFRSAPELPEEEVLSLLLFGRGLDTLSPFQAAQLASAVATLTGRGGAGIVGRLRNSFGLDDLDIATGAEGETALRAGKYLSEKVYTDVVIGSDGKSEINLNLDVTPSVTMRGTLGSDGQTGLGVYYERDY